MGHPAEQVHLKHLEALASSLGEFWYDINGYHIIREGRIYSVLPSFFGGFDTRYSDLKRLILYAAPELNEKGRV
jgi:hypothetical protein